MSGIVHGEPGRWTDGDLPENVQLGTSTVLTGDQAFKRYLSRSKHGLAIGDHSTLDGVQFAIGEDGSVRIGDYCYLTNIILLCELEVQIGSYVVIGWNATIADTDFHPMAPAERVADAIACSPLGKNRSRPAFGRHAVIIEDDVWIGPNAAILKGVRVGAGALIEAGSLVTNDVAPRARIMGNPARVIGEV